MNEKPPSDKDLEGKTKPKENSIPGKKIKEQLLRIRRVMMLISISHLKPPMENVKERRRKRERKIEVSSKENKRYP